MLMFILAVVAGALALGIIPGPAWLAFGYSPSPGLVSLAVFVAFLAALKLLWAFLNPEGADRSYLPRVFGDASAHIALDIFAVLGGAAIIVYLAHLIA